MEDARHIWPSEPDRAEVVLYRGRGHLHGRLHSRHSETRRLDRIGGVVIERRSSKFLQFSSPVFEPEDQGEVVPMQGSDCRGRNGGADRCPEIFFIGRQGSRRRRLCCS